MPNPGASGFVGYRRRIRIDPAPGRCSVEMEDDPHCFGVTVFHEDGIIVRVAPSAPRYPWTTCPDAGRFLAERMEGVALSDAAHVENQRDHCTHIYDLLVLGVTHALDLAPLTYDVRVADAESGASLCEIDRDGKTLLRWRLCADGAGSDATGDLPAGDFAALERWTKELDSALQETGRMLRRGVLASYGRHFEAPTGARATIVPLRDTCYTFQSKRIGEALKTPDSVRDFSARPDLLLGGFL